MSLFVNRSQAEGAGVAAARALVGNVDGKKYNRFIAGATALNNLIGLVTATNEEWGSVSQPGMQSGTEVAGKRLGDWFKKREAQGQENVTEGINKNMHSGSIFTKDQGVGIPTNQTQISSLK